MAAIILTAILLMIICFEGACSITGICSHSKQYRDRESDSDSVHFLNGDKSHKREL
jgi:hypothetical protein